MKRILLIVFLFFSFFAYSEVYAGSSEYASNTKIRNGEIPGVYCIEIRSEPYSNSSGYTGQKYYMVLSVYGHKLERQWYYYYQYGPGAYTYNYNQIILPSRPSDWDDDRYLYLPGIGVWDDEDGFLKGFYYLDDPSPLVPPDPTLYPSLYPVYKDGVVVGYWDPNDLSLYGIDLLPVSPDVFGYVPFYSDGKLLGYMDVNQNWRGGFLNPQNPMVPYSLMSSPMLSRSDFDLSSVDNPLEITGWQTPDGKVYTKTGELWTLPFGRQLEVSNGEVVASLEIAPGIKVVGFTDDGFALLESNGQYCKVPYTETGRNTEGDSTYYALVLDIPINLTPAGDGLGYFYPEVPNAYTPFPSTGNTGSGDTGGGDTGGGDTGGGNTGGGNTGGGIGGGNTEDGDNDGVDIGQGDDWFP